MPINFLSSLRWRCDAVMPWAMATAFLVTSYGVNSADAAELRSISKLAFGPENILFVADWKAAELLALPLTAAPAGSVQPFNLTDFDDVLRRATGSSDVRIEDMKARPGSNQVYVAVSVGRERKPEILAITADGAASRVKVGVGTKTVALEAAPNSGFEFWDKIPERSFTVTDMQWHNGKLYVAGLSNQEFSSTLRIISYPFSGSEAMATVEMYHTSHDQMETRAPIREMTFLELDGKSYLLAAYMCTPLVTIPLEALQNGAHVRGKTIAELGYGNTPNGLVTFDVNWQGTKTSYVLVSNFERNAELVNLNEVAKANARPSMMKQVSFGQIAGLEAKQAPLSGVYRIDNLNEQYLIAVRRDLETGHNELVTFDKALRFRLSDFVSEYNFPGYKYEGQVQVGFIKPVEDTLKKEEGYPVTASPLPNGPFPYKKGVK